MNPVKYWLCYVVSYLNYLPRYGRLYRLRMGTDGRLERSEDGRFTRRRDVEWRWQRYGHWGLNLLDRVNLYWPFHDEMRRRYDVKTLGTLKSKSQLGPSRRAELLSVLIILILLALSVLALLLSD